MAPVTIYALVDSREPWDWRYVGRTVQPLKQRVYHHKWRATRLDKGIHKSRWIRKVLSSGGDVLGVVLEICDEADQVERETAWINTAHAAGFRLTNMTDLGGTATNPSAEVRTRIANSLKGRKRPQHVVEALRLNGRKYVGDKNPNWHNHWSDEQRARMSEQRKGTKCGSDNNAVKLTEADVRAIRALAADGVPFSRIAEGFPVNQQSVANVVRRTTWAHVL